MGIKLYKLIFSKLLNQKDSKNKYLKFIVNNYNNKKFLNKLLSKR